MTEQLSFQGDASDAYGGKLRLPPQNIEAEEDLMNSISLMVGFEGGTLTIVAGRPSMGKSQISLQLALKMILLHDLPVVIFSLEMTKKQLEYRLWSLISVTNAYKHLGLTPLKSDRIRRHRAKFQPLADWEFTLIAKIVDILQNGGGIGCTRASTVANL